jgi:hypothetical protein
MTEKSDSQEITLAADEMIVRYGDRAALVAPDRANSARDRDEFTEYEFWQRVCMELNEGIYQKTRERQQVKAGEDLMDRYGDVFSALASGGGKTN